MLPKEKPQEGQMIWMFLLAVEWMVLGSAWGSSSSSDFQLLSPTPGAPLPPALPQPDYSHGPHGPRHPQPPVSVYRSPASLRAGHSKCCLFQIVHTACVDIFWRKPQHRSTSTARWGFYMKTQQHHNLSMQSHMPYTWFSAADALPLNFSSHVSWVWTHFWPLPVFIQWDLYTTYRPNITFPVIYMAFIQKLTASSEMGQLCPRSHYVSGKVTQPRRGTTGSCKRFFCCLHPLRFSDHSSPWMMEKEGSHLQETLSFFCL